MLTSISQETSLDIIHNRLFEANSNWNQQLPVIPFSCLTLRFVTNSNPFFRDISMTTKSTFAVAKDSLDTSDARVFSQRITTAFLMLLTGAVLLFVVGFAQGSDGILHNAAHDTRHAATFPCH